MNKYQDIEFKVVNYTDKLSALQRIEDQNSIKSKKYKGQPAN